MPKTPGDPTPRCPDDVLADHRHYHCVHTVQYPVMGQTAPLVETVVFHRGTETYWLASYPWSQSSVTLCWTQVKPVVVSHTVYQRV